MTPKSIATMAAALLLGGAAFAATQKIPPGTPANPHPDSPTSLLREARQGADAGAGANAGPVASSPVLPEPGVRASTGKAGKPSARTASKRRAAKSPT